MTSPISKDALLERIERERGLWEDLVAEIGEDRMLQPGATGDWSFKDVVAHLNGWRIVTRPAATAARPRRPGRPASTKTTRTISTRSTTGSTRPAASGRSTRCSANTTNRSSACTRPPRR